MKIILASLVAAGLALAPAAAMAQSASIDVDQTFAGVDTDDNGMISLAEFLLVYTDLTEEQFKQADADGDGSLSEAEFDSLNLQTGSIDAEPADPVKPLDLQSLTSSKPDY